MFHKTKRKIVFAVVGSLLVLMAVTLTAIYGINKAVLQRENIEMLQTYAERYSLDKQPSSAADGKPGSKPSEKPDEGAGAQSENPEPPDAWREKKEPQFQLSTFYSVAYSDTGEVLSVNNGNNALQSQETLLAIAGSILSSGKTSGMTGSMAYLVEKRNAYTLVAMLDATISNNNQAILIRQMMIVGSLALAVLVVISVFLAGWIVKPLEENDKKQKRFVSDAGHELKTPIAVVSANSELLRREIGESEWLNNIDYENERMSDLIKQLLALSKAENDVIPTEPLDFSKLVDGETLPFESLAFEKGKRVEAQIEPDLTVKGNANQLRQLVSILLDNALAHGTGDEIGLTLKHEKHSAVLSITNEADELSGEQLSHLFDRFYRTDEARTETGAHYGLGLSIAKAIADAHSGRISAAYQNGKAVFTVVLPIDK
ncbi:MAG: HAMP domain-containing histidine kinase [Clostridia bacterium]|nr:HAMP domain-containing histidine kinase [Clostridia bacterium]